jgi:pimeloyl-ACP methyl ester carboxylesterase
LIAGIFWRSPDAAIAPRKPRAPGLRARAACAARAFYPGYGSRPYDSSVEPAQLPAELSMDPVTPTSTFVSAPDGLKLHVRSWGPRIASGMPVVCLPGLARSGADFEALAAALADDRGGQGSPRRVHALDLRGRGRSEYDSNPDNYSLAVELSDVLAVITALEIGEAVFVGTSRGGILSMLLATARPTAIAGCVLNDIGPVIEPAGLARIKSYVGKLPRPRTFQDGADILRGLFAAQFPRLSDKDWMGFARRTFKDADGEIVPDYDVRLNRVLAGVDPAQPLAALWKEFDALARTPVLVVRGANSDILSNATVAAMRARAATVEAIEVPDQGHAPLLAEADIIEQIAAFVAACESRRECAPA